MAITRNASEALQIAQLGIDLKAGDEVVTTNQDYGRMLDTWEQRVRRDGIVVKQISFPVPPPIMDELTGSASSRRSRRRRRSSHFCHITNLTGQIFPVQRDLRGWRAPRGIETIVDGAHAFAHFPFTPRDLECDYYGTSLHKWLLAPIGTGFLYVRRENIEKLWPLMPAGESQDERHPQVRGDRHAPGGEPQRDRRGARVPPGDRRRAQGRAAALPADRWAKRLETEPRVKILTSLDPSRRARLATSARGRRRVEGVRVPVGQAPHHHRRRSSTTEFRGCASRRTSTRRSTRSTRSRRRSRTC